MPDHAVIADVSTTLTATLTQALSVLVPAPTPIAQVHDLVGGVSTAPPTLTVFLYEVVEDPHVKNRPPIRTDAPPDTLLRRAPMGLILRYLVTPWSDDRLTDQQMLACALRSLHDSAILSGPQLSGGLAGTNEALKVSLTPLNIEDRTRIFHGVQKPYRLSLAYEVRVVNLDSLVERTVVPVSNRVLDGVLPAAG